MIYLNIQLYNFTFFLLRKSPDTISNFCTYLTA